MPSGEASNGPGPGHFAATPRDARHGSLPTGADTSQAPSQGATMADDRDNRQSEGRKANAAVPADRRVGQGDGEKAMQRPGQPGESTEGKLATPD